MADWAQIKQARLRAFMRAEQYHQQLDTDQTQPIDVFKIIEDQRIWLFFKPLEKLFGVYVKSDNIPGIFVNSKHPNSLQRYTAAHELGHHVLEHGFSLDKEEQILNRRSYGQQVDLREVEAQTFAAHFLMPLKLVNTTLQRMDLPLKPGTLEPQTVYEVSLELGASYQATVIHLSNLDKITRRAANTLFDHPPKLVKQNLQSGARLDSRADVWPLAQADSGRRLHPRVKDRLAIRLPDTPSSGYIWMPIGEGIANRRAQESEDDALFALALDEFGQQPAEKGEFLIGGEGERLMVFQVLKRGQYQLRLERKRPWLPNAQPLDSFEVELAVTPSPTGDSDQGMSERQRRWNALDVNAA